MKSGLAALLRKKCAILFTGMLIICSGSAAYTGQNGSTLLGYAVFPDIVKTLDMMETIAGRIDPAQFKPGSLKEQAGKILNDPALAGIDRTKPLMVTVYYKSESAGTGSKGIANVSYAFFIPAKDKEACKKAFDGMNMPGKIERDVLVVSNNTISLDGALKEIDLYKKTAAQKLQSDARFLLKIDSVMSVFDSEINMLVSRLQKLDSQQSDNTGQTKQAESLIAIGKLFLYGMLDLTTQSKDYQLDISVSENALLFSSEHSAKPGSALDNFFDGIAPDGNRCLTLLPEKGDFTYAGYFDMRRLNILIDIIVKSAIKRDPSLKDRINMDLINEYRNFIGYYSGEFALAYGFDNNSHLRMDFAASTNRSAKSHLAMNERFIALYRETLKKLSPGAETFTEYTLQKYVRKSGGFDVHRYVLKMNYSGMSKEEKASMFKMFGNDLTTEYAVVNGFVVASTSPEALDKMIVNAGTGGGSVELQSIKAFDSGMDSYYDFDIAGFIKKIAIMSGSAEGKQKDPGTEKTLDILDKLAPEDRVLVSSSKYSKGTSYNRSRISVKLITDMMKFFNEQKAASIKGEQPAYKN